MNKQISALHFVEEPMPERDINTPPDKVSLGEKREKFEKKEKNLKHSILLVIPDEWEVLCIIFSSACSSSQSIMRFGCQINVYTGVSIC